MQTLGFYFCSSSDACFVCSDMKPIIRFVKRASMLDDAPWTWGDNWHNDMPEFFAGFALYWLILNSQWATFSMVIIWLIYPDMPKGVYDNIYGELKWILFFSFFCSTYAYSWLKSTRHPTKLLRADDLDDSPVTWHITEPVDPNEYQNEWLGSVINIY